VLKTGEVVTVEPGLYYPEIGAVRIEDMVLVTKTGCVNLTKFPKILEV
jgi:Xaa-Pro aminopeptidase